MSRRRKVNPLRLVLIILIVIALCFIAFFVISRKLFIFKILEILFHFIHYTIRVIAHALHGLRSALDMHCYVWKMIFTYQFQHIAEGRSVNASWIVVVVIVVVIVIVVVVVVVVGGGGGGKACATGNIVDNEPMAKQGSGPFNNFRAESVNGKAGFRQLEAFYYFKRLAEPAPFLIRVGERGSRA